MHYTEEETKELVEAYTTVSTREEQEAVVLAYAEKFKKPKASIIMKLSKAGVYKPKKRLSSITGKKPKNKEDMVVDLEILLKVPEGHFRGLDKAPKTTINNIMEKFNEFIEKYSSSKTT